MTSEPFEGGRLRAMNDHGYAIDLFIGECARGGLAEATRLKYTELLYELADYLETRAVPPHRMQLDHCRAFLDTKLKPRPPRRGQRSPRPPVSKATLALYVTILRRYVGFLADEGILELDYSPKLKRPKRPRPEDVEVVTTSSGDLGRMFAACTQPTRSEEWDELLCIATLAYLGPRRNAAGQVRRQDVDLDAGLMRFVEKGGKVIWKPIPDALLDLYRAADAAGVWLEPRDFLIPNRGPTREPGKRSSKVIYAIVKRVAARARVSAHPHALRAAFAVQFDEQFPQLQHTLQLLLGHSRPETTQVYLRRKNKALAMEAVRGLSFGLRPNPGVPPAGFEPALWP
jgi:integrase